MKISKIIFLINLICILNSCSSDEPKDETVVPVKIELSRADKEQLQNNNDLTFNLLSFCNTVDIKNGKNNEDIVIAPYSMSTSLSMAANCLSGDDLRQIEKMLGFKNLQDINNLNKKLLSFLAYNDPKITLSIANSMWSKPGSIFCTEKLKSTIKDYYYAPTFEADLSTNEGMDNLNSWCSKATNGLIPNFLEEPVDVEIMMINTNYFHGEWTEKFDKTQTKPCPFTDATGTKRVVSTMNNELIAKVAFSENFKMVSLPYGNKNFNMNLILPEDNISVEEIINSLNGNQWYELISKSENKLVAISLPKFKFDYRADFLNYVSDVKIDNPTGESSPLKISFANQAVSIETNEDGTTSTVVSGTGLIPTTDIPIQFVFNKPFLFIINEINTDAILFAGVVKNP